MTEFVGTQHISFGDYDLAILDPLDLARYTLGDSWVYKTSSHTAQTRMGRWTTALDAVELLKKHSIPYSECPSHLQAYY